MLYKDALGTLDEPLRSKVIEILEDSQQHPVEQRPSLEQAMLRARQWLATRAANDPRVH